MRWRLIRTPPAPGRYNMAVDRALFEGFSPGVSVPFIRIYTWSPPAVSVGRFQQPEEILDLDRCSAEGLDIARRLTGGSAILHDDEVTYSLLCSAGMLRGMSVTDSYLYLSGFILRAWRKSGIDAGFACERDPGRVRRDTGFCFSGACSYDTVSGGRKLGGSAQRRTRDKIFQHGSLPLSTGDDPGRFFRVPVGNPGEGAPPPGHGVTRESLADALVESFSDLPDVTLEEIPLTAREKEAAEKLIEETGKTALA